MTSTLKIVGLLLSLVLSGCTSDGLSADRRDVRVRGAMPGDVPELMATATEFTLFEIDSNDLEEPEFGDVANAVGTPENPRICGYRILKTVPIQDSETKRTLTNDLMRAIVRADGTLFCFMPQHAIQAHGKDGWSVTLVICYHCAQIKVYSEWGETWSTISNDGREYMDRLLGIE